MIRNKSFRINSRYFLNLKNPKWKYEFISKPYYFLMGTYRSESDGKYRGTGNYDLQVQRKDCEEKVRQYEERALSAEKSQKTAEEAAKIRYQ